MSRSKSRIKGLDGEAGLIRSVGKAFIVLELIGREKELGIAEMITRLGWKKSTVHRIASTLEKLGYLHQNPTNMKYKLSFKLFTLGNLTETGLNINEAALPFLQKLQSRTGESVYLGIMDRNEVLYVKHLPSHHVLQALVQVGTRAPLHCTAIGKVLLSQLNVQEIRRITRFSGLKKFTPNTIASFETLQRALSDIRRKGFSIDNEEYHLGIRSLAAPLRNEITGATAAISVAGPTVRLPLEKLEQIADLVKSTAQSISDSLSSAVYPKMTAKRYTD